MEISGKNSPIQMDAYVKQVYRSSPGNAQATGAAHAGSEKDKVELSDQARQAQQAAQELKGMPDIRYDKVAQVRNDIDNGTYKVVGDRVAVGILRESFENDLILHKIQTSA